jgi:hypothetical protein
MEIIWDIIKIIAGWIIYQFIGPYSKLKQEGAQAYEYGLYGRIRYWLHGIFNTLEKKDKRMFKKPSKWRWEK